MVERKLSVVFGLRIPACLYGLFLFVFWEVSKANLFLVEMDVNRPFFVTLMPVNTSMAGFVIREWAAILHLLRSRSLAEIGAAIVQSIVVYVVAKLALHAAKNNAMHSGTAVGPFGIEGFGCFAPMSVPIPLHQEVINVGIDDSDISMRERNVSDRLVLRLNNRRALAAWTGHDLTSNEIAVFDRISIIFERIKRRGHNFGE